MKKILIVLGGISIMTSMTSVVISCQDPKKEMFTLISEGGKPIDFFDKSNVLDYFFKTTTIFPDDTAPLVMVFKDGTKKDYGFPSGNIAYWMKHLYKGLDLKPAQEKYEMLQIQDWAWQLSGVPKD